MKARLAATAVLWVLVLLSAVPLSAQETAPIIVFADGNLWMLPEAGNGELIPLTNDGNIQVVQMSPDGTQLAYLTLAPLTLDAIERVGGIGGGALPSDIWIMNIQSGESIPVAVQADNASFFTEGVEDNALLRSGPSWSPDGTQIVWAEVHYPSFASETNRLVSYTINTGETTELVAGLPEPAGVPGPLDVQWGEGGLAVLNFTMNTADGTMDTVILAFNLDGTQSAGVTIPQDETHIFDNFVWVNQAGQPAIAVLYSAPNWDLIDPQTGEITPGTGALELYSLSSPDTSLGLRYAYNPQAAEFWMSHVWAAATPDGQVIDLAGIQGTPDSLALSPAGDAIAYVTAEGRIDVWRMDGTVQNLSPAGSVPLFARVLWGPMGWRIGQGEPPTVQAGPTPAPTIATTVPEADACVGTTIPPRLLVGAQGRVLGEPPNVIRTAPGTGDDSAIIGQIAGGEIFDILEGPQCDTEGRYWWRVDYNGVVGWTAEGEGTEYWLEPVG